MKGIEVSEKDLQGVIANYLFINMYEDTYKFFIQETHFNGNIFNTLYFYSLITFINS